MCAVHVHFKGFPSGGGRAESSLSFFCLQTVRAMVWHDRSKLFETLTIFLITLSRNKDADKTGGAQAGLGICCSNVPKVNFS